MERRRFLASLLGALPLTVMPAASAGFQHHAGSALWPQFAIGQSLSLLREPDNAHDAKAVAVLWRGQRIGYVPRMENVAVSQMLDRGESLIARIIDLAESRNPWVRVRMAIAIHSSVGGRT